MNTILLSRPAPIPTISTDGYIRLSLATLSNLPFTHLASEIDLDFLDELKMQTVAAQAAGFSEWISDTTPTISLGWGWFVHDRSRRLLLAPDAIRSNVMLIDIHGYDLGTSTTSHLFRTWLAAYDWQNSVASALGTSMMSTC